MPSVVKDYEVLCTIGSGSYGTCKKIRRIRDGKVTCLKILQFANWDHNCKLEISTAPTSSQRQSDFKMGVGRGFALKSGGVVHHKCSPDGGT